MSENIPVYSIQRTYIIKPVDNPGNPILTCDRRIDIPTIEPLLTMTYGFTIPTIIYPCVELAGDFLSAYNLEFETNEGVTVLPVKIDSGMDAPSENPYLLHRYVLMLPRGATGVKSCRVIYKATGNEFRNNFTFGIMPPPYNYDNALFGYLSYRAEGNHKDINALDSQVTNLKARVTALENKAGV